jgi:type I restriction enzyme S subunit
MGGAKMKHRAYPAYKPSGMEWVGDIPEHWEVHRLKHVASVQFSSVDKHTIEGEEPVRLCNYVDVYYNDFIKEGIEFMSATATRSEIARFHLHHGDVLVTKDSESWDDIAVPAYVAEELDGVLCGYHLAHIRPDLRKLIGEYLFRAFRSSGINDQFRVAANGITRFGLGKYWLDNGLFLVPPVEEQQAIASFLDRETARIDTLIEKKQRQIELLQEKRSALISHAVTKGLDPHAKMKDSGIEWLGQVPVNWHHRKLGYIASMSGGSTPSKANDDYWDGTIPWVSPKNMKKRDINDSEDHISDEAVRETSLRLLEPPVVLIVVRGMILAHTFPVALTSASVTINQDMKALKPKPGLNADYLAFLLEGISSLILSLVEESAHGTKCLRTELWKNISVFMPDENEQTSICTYLHDHNAKLGRMIERIEDSLEKLREYRISLISAAVTGKIDVRKEVS